MSDQVHAPAAFLLRKQPPVPLNSILGNKVSNILKSRLSVVLVEVTTLYFRLVEISIFHYYGQNIKKKR